MAAHNQIASITTLSFVPPWSGGALSLEVQVNFRKHGGTHVDSKESLEAKSVVYKLVSGFIPPTGVINSNSFGPAW